MTLAPRPLVPRSLAMPLAPAMPLPRRLGPPGAPQVLQADADVALKFETLIAATLLRTARAGRLGDDGLGEAGDTVRDLVDGQRAEAIARAAPMGVAGLLAAERRR